MPTALTKQINETLLKNPKLVEVLFQDIFGKYMIKYYGEQTKNYRVLVSTDDQNSYMNSRDNVVVIAMRNVADQLKLGINVYAVAYHELAHILYTNDNIRDQIRVKAHMDMQSDDYQIDQAHLQTLSVESKHKYIRNTRATQEKQLHMLWNVVEDERIERLIMNDHPFLTDILDPLKTIIKDDGKIMSWRLGKYAKKVPDARIAQLCEQYHSVYNSNAIVIPNGHTINKEFADRSVRNTLAQILYELHKLMFPTQEQGTEPPIIDPLKPKKRGKGKSENKTQGGDEPVDNQDDKDDDNDDDNDDNDDNNGKDDDNDDNNGKDDKKIAREKKEDELNKQLQNQIDKAKELIQTVVAEINYQSSVLPEDQRKPLFTDPRFKNMFITEIPLITQQRTTIRGGMTQAQRKSFKSDISPKINVARLVETMSNKSEPKVFYSKGKDASPLRKVVIFEDVSSSTYGGGRLLSPMFSMIAYALAKSFDECDWWIYGDLLAKKHKVDYAVPSQVVGRKYRMASGTRSSYLANVMRKYAQEKALFVVITDGDIQSLIQDNELFKRYVNQTAFIGYIKQDEAKQLKHKSIMDDNLFDYVNHASRKPEYTIAYDALDSKREAYLRKTKNDFTNVDERYAWAETLFALHASKLGFENIMKDTKIRQFIIDSVRTIASVMKGAMK